VINGLPYHGVVIAESEYASVSIWLHTGKAEFAGDEVNKLSIFVFMFNVTVYPVWYINSSGLGLTAAITSLLQTVIVSYIVTEAVCPLCYALIQIESLVEVAVTIVVGVDRV
jgi:hypothetical protein